MTARKKFEDHGGVLTLLQALYHAVHDYPGGLPVVCAHFGWDNIGTMRNKFSLTVHTHVPTLAEAEMVLELTRDPRILTALGHPVDAVWHWLDELPELPADLDVLESGSSVIGRANRVLQELTEALRNDGAVDAREMARIKQAAYETQQALGAFLKVAEGFHCE